MNCLHKKHEVTEPLGTHWLLVKGNQIIEIVRIAGNEVNHDPYAVYPNNAARYNNGMMNGLTLDERHFECFMQAYKDKGFELVDKLPHGVEL